jgi:hypothetical protein
MSSIFQTFFEELLKEQTIVVPGIFFDINPSHRRNLFSSPCHHFVRISFGPPLEDLDRGADLLPKTSALLLNTGWISKGLDAMERIVRKARKDGVHTFGHSYRKSIDSIASMDDHI